MTYISLKSKTSLETMDQIMLLFAGSSYWNYWYNWDLHVCIWVLHITCSSKFDICFPWWLILQCIDFNGTYTKVIKHVIREYALLSLTTLWTAAHWGHHDSGRDLKHWPTRVITRFPYEPDFEWWDAFWLWFAANSTNKLRCT